MRRSRRRSSRRAEVVEEVAQVVEHRAEADDRRDERRAEARRLRRELLPPVVVGARGGGVAARLAPRCAAIMPRSATDSGSDDEQRDARTCRPARTGARVDAAQSFPEARPAPPSDEEPVGEQLILQPDQPGQRPLARRRVAPAASSVARVVRVVARRAAARGRGSTSANAPRDRLRRSRTSSSDPGRPSASALLPCSRRPPERRPGTRRRRAPNDDGRAITAGDRVAGTLRVPLAEIASRAAGSLRNASTP